MFKFQALETLITEEVTQSQITRKLVLRMTTLVSMLVVGSAQVDLESAALAPNSPLPKQATMTILITTQKKTLPWTSLTEKKPPSGRP